MNMLRKYEWICGIRMLTEHVENVLICWEDMNGLNRYVEKVWINMWYSNAYRICWVYVDKLRGYELAKEIHVEKEGMSMLR